MLHGQVSKLKALKSPPPSPARTPPVDTPGGAAGAHRQPHFAESEADADETIGEVIGSEGGDGRARERESAADAGDALAGATASARAEDVTRVRASKVKWLRQQVTTLGGELAACKLELQRTKHAAAQATQLHAAGPFRLFVCFRVSVRATVCAHACLLARCHVRPWCAMVRRAAMGQWSPCV